MQQESFAWKAERFFGKNWKFIFWGLIIAIIVIAYELHLISTRMAKLEKTVADNNGKVVLTTIDGRAIKVTKTPLKAELLKKFIVSTLVNNMIVSRASLTNEYRKSDFKKASDILRQSKNLAMIYQNYIDKKDKTAMGYFVGYLNWILSALAQDKLPDYIDIKDYKIDSYTYNGNKWHAEITIYVSTNNYIIAKDRYERKDGEIKIVADGKVDLAESTDVNPYGVKIERFKIVMPTK